MPAFPAHPGLHRGGEGNCVEWAAGTPVGRIHLRQSDRPHETTTAAPHALAGLLDAVRRGVVGGGAR
ncbi:DUF397 domain-containing protein [Streptomyces sp. CWNU-52B]|uniref:DUF397 domain-containing protein n=1 Tax=unclassified Streptomyces TaxID=2593676 RepID=UPI0039C28A82